MDSVSVVKCGDYDIENVKKSVKMSIDLLGGINTFVKPGEKVLLKANLLMKRKPERATTTHPALVEVIAGLVIEAGGLPVIGDSPGGYYSYNKATLESIYEICGMKEAAEKSGAKLNYDTEMVDTAYPQGMIAKSMKIIKPVTEVDKIINMPKLKTHVMAVYSGAVKNLFGIIPGRYKAEYHLRFGDIGDFSDLLIDICEFSKPVLTVMDAVIGMEGYGPSNGSPRKTGLILSSASPYALDIAATKIIGFEPSQIPSIKRSVERGLISGDFDDINILGEQIKDVSVPDFKKPTIDLSPSFYDRVLPRFVSKRLIRITKAKPVFDHKVCSGCGVCCKSCPPNAIEMKDGKPCVDLDKCISCFCCHELCIFAAVHIKRPWLIRMLLR